ISAAAAPPAGCGAGELRFVESPEKKDFTLLANDGLDDVGAGVADAVDAGAGGAPLPVRPPKEEHAASVAAAGAARAASRQLPRSISFRKAPPLAVCNLRLLRLIMRTPSSGRLPVPISISSSSGKGEVGRRLSLAVTKDRPTYHPSRCGGSSLSRP